MSVMVKFTGICMILISGFLASVRGQNINHWETVIYNNEIWKYFIGSSEPDAAWRSLSFDDGVDKLFQDKVRYQPFHFLLLSRIADKHCWRGFYLTLGRQINFSLDGQIDA